MPIYDVDMTVVLLQGRPVEAAVTFTLEILIGEQVFAYTETLR